ncbi:uncharacterized protein LOC115438238 [Sphaeramia orbicularis]|uniref:uncharacterized protein LOC115438238 n=1 Tax=Sphaeramia orbicularis TaxID=375764 RepID=UPI00117EA2B4|nr:uncharacterized protein LOC115438238 [Sphaeramia orbicularis]
MVTPGLCTSWLRALRGSCVTAILLITGSTGLVCYTAVESLDLGCLLRWDCPHASPNTTYTVQTKTHGDPWQDVSWCVWVSSHSCDVSPAFSNFELYNMIRLGVHLSTSSTVWIKPHKFDYTDFTFSPPSVSVSVQGQQLVVKVQFPCAANRRCSMERCCPITELIDPWTTVTLYNTLNSEHQSRTIWTQEAMCYVEFSGLVPGQNYCAVANFSFPTFAMAASPKSSPQCVQTVSLSDERDLLPVLCLVIGLSTLLFVLFVLVFLYQPRPVRPVSENQPKSLPSVHDPVSLVPLALVPVDLCDIHLELSDHVSVQSSSSASSTVDQSSAFGTVYPCDQDPRPGEACWDSGGAELGQCVDSGISIITASHSSEDTCRTNGD